MSIDRELFLAALRTQATEGEESAINLAIEKMGDEAFDWLLGEVRGGALTPSENVRALRLLARLTRQFCVLRKGDLLGVTFALAEDPTAVTEVRSTAVHIAIMEARIARSLEQAASAYRRSVQDVYAQVSRVVRRALEIGVLPEMEAFGREFLSANVDLRHVEERLEAVLRSAEGWLPSEQLEEIRSLVRAGEPGVALESFCTQLEECDVAVPERVARELGELASMMGMKPSRWIERGGHA